MGCTTRRKKCIPLTGAYFAQHHLGARVRRYPQLAIAIGGANSELSVMADGFADFKGLGHQTYIA